ncbi:MAG: hypothetical protein MUE97_01570 [Phycisphaerales bacterium]|nr:hypothetical protein [Phycisphaerales bacterium]
MVKRFDGDARMIWNDGDAEQIICRLTDTLGMGPQLARMTLLGLRECGLAKGNIKGKADTHVLRVSGRLTRGEGFATREIALSDAVLAELGPRDNWKFDLPLYTTGREVCHASNPQCDVCPFRRVCAYAKSATA